MGETQVKRIMIAAPSSSSGKTTVTCALLQALADRGLDLVAFKCGPDYIDPLFHQKVLGVESRNLDTYFAGQEGIRRIMSSYGGRYAVIEGVMGIYDGRSPDSIEGSCYEIAKASGTPIILVVDASSTSRTVISVIKGILLDDTSHLIKGVILNKISPSFYERLGPVLDKELREFRCDVRLLGCFPRSEDIAVKSRHLGLLLPGEVDDIKRRISEAASILEEGTGVDEIIAIMEDAPFARGTSAIQGSQKKPCLGSKGKHALTLSVAFDDAFCFYYRDNLDMFKERGVEINFFSPLTDERLPDRCDALLLGGGYPENHLKELSGNKSMLLSIKEAIDRGIPSLAECGGFMYLHREISDMQGKSLGMVGAVDAKCRYMGRLVRFGYMQIEKETEHSPQDELSRCLVGMKGHEFHYYDSSRSGDSFLACKPLKGASWECMVTGNNAFWGFPHFYYRSAPGFIDAFIERMKEVRYG